MLNSDQTLERYYAQMRWRVLSIAADFDRIARASGGPDTLKIDPRVQDLRACLNLILDTQPEKARRVEELLSDHTPPPAR